MNWCDAHIADLAKQLAYSPADKRHAQMSAAAGLIGEIDPAREYPWEFVLFRITGYRPTKPIEDTVTGKALRSDLSCLVEELSATLNLPLAAAGEPVLSQEQVARQLSVADKTIQRWRKLGLVGRRYVCEDGRRRLGFLGSEVRTFMDAHPTLIERATNFQQVGEDERRRILRLAERLAVRGGLSLKQISHRIGRKLNRSPETIRTIIRKHDKVHVADAIFPDPQFTPPSVDRDAIIAEWENGGSVDDIAVTFGRSRAAVLKILAEARVEKARAMKIEWMDNPLFNLPDAEKIILTDLPREAADKLAGTGRSAEDLARELLRELLVVQPSQGLPAYLEDAMRHPPLPRELEVDAFRRMNFLKRQAAAIQKTLDPKLDCEGQLLRMAALLAEAHKIKNDQVQRHIRVAVFVARKHQRSWHDLLELISDATVWLMHAADKFDFARGTRFGTYASYVMMKNFARDREDSLTADERRLVTGQDELLNQLASRDAEPIAEWAESSPTREKLSELMRELPARERALLSDHYGLDPAQPALSLAQLGEKMGVTKARVAQIEARALETLKKIIAGKTSD